MNAVLSRFLLLLFFALLSGCEKDDIRTYSAPRDDDPGSGPYRVLAAIIPVGDDTWVFKLAGRYDILQLVEPGFDQVLNSLTFPEVKTPKDKSLAWKAPSGWNEEKKEDPMTGRESTLTIKGMSRPELTISKLGPGAAAIKPNVDRWRRQDLGLIPISLRALEKVVRERTVAGHRFSVIDMRGPGATAASRPAMPHMGKRPASRLPFTFRTPEGWQEGGRSAMAVVVMVVREGGETAELKVTPLSKSMPGGLLANVNRWRDEVGLSDLTAGELKNVTMPTVKVDGRDAKVLDLQGKSKRSLVAWFERGNTTWFFKLLGPTRLVGAQRKNFENFMESVQFTGGADE